MIYGTLLEPSDILEAGDLRICTAGRYQRVPEDQIGQAIAEPQIVQVSGGIVTHGHDAFFREQNLGDSPMVQKLRDEILSLSEKDKQLAGTQSTPVDADP